MLCGRHRQLRGVEKLTWGVCVVTASLRAVSLEFQREKAKELTKFFKQQAANKMVNDAAYVHAHRTRERVNCPQALLAPPSLLTPLSCSTTARSGLGWTKTNEINNGRWVMFGLLVGMMTEFATGVVRCPDSAHTQERTCLIRPHGACTAQDFPNQLKLTVSVLGIADVYD